MKMKKIKVIDLLTKIANGEEVPKKIKFNDEEYTLGYGNTYEDKNGNFLLGGRYNNLILNDEVEIIKEEKEIEKINIISDTLIAFDDKYQDINIGGCTPTQIAFATKINEIIDVINDMRDKE